MLRYLFSNYTIVSQQQIQYTEDTRLVGIEDPEMKFSLAPLFNAFSDSTEMIV